MDAENLKSSINDNVDISIVLCRVMYTLMEFLCIVLFHKVYLLCIFFVYLLRDIRCKFAAS